MRFLPRFTFTAAMVRNLGTIESARAVIDIRPLPPDRVLSIRQAARRRVTRNSTGIVGNTLEGHDEAAFGKIREKVQLNY